MVVIFIIFTASTLSSNTLLLLLLLLLPQILLLLELCHAVTLLTFFFPQNKKKNTKNIFLFFCLCLFSFGFAFLIHSKNSTPVLVVLLQPSPLDLLLANLLSTQLALLSFYFCRQNGKRKIKQFKIHVYVSVLVRKQMLKIEKTCALGWHSSWKLIKLKYIA